MNGPARLKRTPQLRSEKTLRCTQAIEIFNRIYEISIVCLFRLLQDRLDIRSGSIKVFETILRLSGVIVDPPIHQGQSRLKIGDGSLVVF